MPSLEGVTSSVKQTEGWHLATSGCRVWPVTVIITLRYASWCDAFLPDAWLRDTVCVLPIFVMHVCVMPSYLRDAFYACLRYGYLQNRLVASDCTLDWFKLLRYKSIGHRWMVEAVNQCVLVMQEGNNGAKRKDGAVVVGGWLVMMWCP